jgi:hypothetical protein
MVRVDSVAHEYGGKTARCIRRTAYSINSSNRLAVRGEGFQPREAQGNPGASQKMAAIKGRCVLFHGDVFSRESVGPY